MRRASSMALALFLALTACTTHPSGPLSPRSPAHASASPSREALWAADIAYLVEHMESLHPDLYHGVTRQEVHAAADDLVAGLAERTDDQILVGVMHLVALISSKGRDGHMGVWPPDNPGLVHRYPIRLWEFPDGIHVTAARSPYESLLGARLVAVDGVPIQQVLSRLDPVVPRDNDSNLRAARLVYLTSAEVLAGLGIAHDDNEVELEIEGPDGPRATITVEAVDAATYADWVGGWELTLPQRSDMLWLRDLDAEFSLSVLGTHTLYVQYNHVLDTSSDVAGAIRRQMRDHPIDRVVLDLRNNGGGEAEGYGNLLDLLAGPTVDRPGGLYVLIGRLSFSAASSFAAEMEQRVANVTFVGEDTGGAPNFWADPVTVTLPNSRMKALVSETYEGYGQAGDPRLTIQPDVAVPLTWQDYEAGRDPVLDAAL